MDVPGHLEEPFPEYKVRRPRLFLPLVLFLATVITTLMAGALQQGADIFHNPRELTRGLPFSFTLLAILSTHELGHFFASRRHGVEATLPYFIPAPTFLGTFGAFIKMRSPIKNKQALLDIGAAGPLSGFAVSVIATLWGLSLSQVIPTPPEGGLSLGSPIIFHILSYITIGQVPEGQDVLLHPVAFAGWLGFFITSLNLLPIGQLDGGHMVYAILGKRHRVVSLTMIPILIVLGIFTWPGWLIWAVLSTFLGIGHPPIIDAYTPLDRRRRWIGWFTLVVFVITFIPNPFDL